MQERESYTKIMSHFCSRSMRSAIAWTTPYFCSRSMRVNCMDSSRACFFLSSVLYSASVSGTDFMGAAFSGFASPTPGEEASPTPEEASPPRVEEVAIGPTTESDEDAADAEEERAGIRSELCC